MSSLNRLKSIDQAALAYKLACKFNIPTSYWAEIKGILARLDLDHSYIEPVASFVDLKMATHSSEFLALNVKSTYIVWDSSKKSLFTSPLLEIFGEDHWSFNEKQEFKPVILKKRESSYFPHERITLNEKDFDVSEAKKGFLYTH